MKTFSLFIFLAAVFLFGCKKAGTGGKASVVVSLKHHGKPIPGTSVHPDTVFVKFNAEELPGTKAGDFDTYFVSNAGDERIELKGLKKGKYYLFGIGWDTDINQRVTGGMAIKIKWSERNKETDAELAVTE